MRKVFCLILTLGVALITLQSCGFPWSNSNEIALMTISRNNGTVAPEFYEESSMSVKPDYELRTISVDYTMIRPIKEIKTAEDTFKGDAVIGGEYFDEFDEVVKVINAADGPGEKEPCLGAPDVSVTLKKLGGDDMTVVVGGCGKDDGRELVEKFHTNVVDLLTNNVY